MSDQPETGPVHLPVVPTGMADLGRAAPNPTGGADLPAPRVDPPAASSDAAGAGAADAAGNDAQTAFEKKLLEGKVIAAISEIYDPEIPVNIYELGLIYKVDVHDDRSVDVQMTLTAPACPVAGSLPGQVEQKIESIPEVARASVELVWDPPWSRDRMSEAAQLQLGLM